MTQNELYELNRTIESFYSQTHVPVCVIDSLDGVISSVPGFESRTWPKSLFEYILSKRNQANISKNTPFLSYSPYGIFAGLIIYEDVYLGVGPVMVSNIPLADMTRTYSGVFSPGEVVSVYDIVHKAPKMNAGFFANSLSLLNKLVNGNFVPYTEIIDVNTDFDNNITNSQDRNAGEITTAGISENIDALVEFENSLEAAIESGSRERINRLWDIPDYVFFDEVINVPNAMNYMAIRLITIMNRAALKSGADTKTVFETTDKYIRRLESTVNSNDKYVMIADASFAFCNLVAAYRSHGAFALPARKCARYIEENLGQKITTADLAILCGISERQIYRVFKEAYNSSVSEYITKKRLERSVILLKTTTLSVAEISANCGFFSQSYFTKAFKQQYNLTPTEFKK